MAQHTPEHVHEEKDVGAKAVLITAAAFLPFCVLMALVVFVLFGFFERTRPEAEVSPLAPTRELPPNPRLQVYPRVDLQEMRTRENVLLHQYAWIDKDKGIVRIPIERAIELIAQRGLPKTPAAPPKPTASGGQHAVAIH
jgi:hypothetical protein